MKGNKINPAAFSFPSTKNYGTAPRESRAREMPIFWKGTAQRSPPWRTASPTPPWDPGSLQPPPSLPPPAKSSQGGCTWGKPRLALSRTVSASPSLPGPRTVRTLSSKILTEPRFSHRQTRKVLNSFPKMSQPRLIPPFFKNKF